MPISYDNAFGGTDERMRDPAQLRSYLPNPVGRGWHHHIYPELVIGTPVSNTEEISDPVRDPGGKVPADGVRTDRPRAGRRASGMPGHTTRTGSTTCSRSCRRISTRGTFSVRRRISRLRRRDGGEPVVLINLTPDGRREFALPSVEVPVVFFRRRADRVETKGTLDTLLFEPDAQRFSLVWRAKSEAAARHIRSPAGGGGPDVARLVAVGRDRQELSVARTRSCARRQRTGGLRDAGAATCRSGRRAGVGRWPDGGGELRGDPLRHQQFPGDALHRRQTASGWWAARSSWKSRGAASPSWRRWRHARSRECFAAAGREARSGFRCWCALLSRSGQDGSKAYAHVLLHDIERELGFRLHPHSRVIEQGRVGGAVALLQARRMLD